MSKRTGEKIILKSWKSPSDPSVGSFSASFVESRNIIQVFIWNENQPYWRSGPYNGRVLTRIDTMTATYFKGFEGGDDGNGNIIIYYTIPDGLDFLIYNLNSQGNLDETLWDDKKKELQVTWTSRKSDCDVYGICGAFASCSSLSIPICSCLKGFEPRNIQEWNRNNWTGGCVRRTPLQCERVINKTTTTKKDGFFKLQAVKVPDFAEGLAVTPDICRSLCLENCSCTAYSNGAGIGCMSWTGNLIDIEHLQTGGLDLYFRVAHEDLDSRGNKTIIITISAIIGTLTISICAYIMWRRTSKNTAKLWHSIKSKRVTDIKAFRLFYKGGTSEVHTSGDTIDELLLFDFEKLATATNNFDLSNKLGQGGFGPVYKGKLQDGQEIAVKRLSRASGQGLEEFMNEVVVLCKLQHRNLVRLLGCCVDGDEKML
ncbi:G-type lectin S-receptor-like serine/threonine-kinase, partial [Trifolium pratense]